MPNHVINEMIFRDVDAAAQEAILAATCNAEGVVDFTVLVPIPLNIWLGNASSAHDKAFGSTWYDWCSTNWGTKWNAYSQKDTEQTDTTLTLRFETAWRPPYPWLAAVFNKLNLPFEHNWLDEGASRGVAGRFWTDETMGKDWREEPADDPLHRHLHKLHWGVEEFEDEEA